MIGIFKNNLFFNSLLLLPYVIIVRIHSFIYPVTYETLASDTILTKLVFGFFGSGLTQNIVATVLVYFQILYINRLVIKHGLANQITLLPGLIYALMVSFLPEYCLLTPYLIANTFVLISVDQIFKTYKRPKAADLLFNIGFLIAVASLFIPNYIFLLSVGLVGLLVLRSLKIRELFQMLFGVALVYFAFGGILYLLNLNVIQEMVKITMIPRATIFENRGEGLYKIMVIFIFSMYAIINYRRYTLKKSIQTQKKIDILFWFMIASVLLLFFFSSIEPSQVLLLFIPLAIMINFNYLNIKSTLIQEIIHVCLLVLLFALHFGFI